VTRLLALDVGSKRIGVAACDELGLIARPLEVEEARAKLEALVASRRSAKGGQA